MTTAPVQAPNVHALIVGIEKYRAGTEYNLNGPANDALKFAEWLLQHGTEPRHIHLFLSPLEQNQGVSSKAKGKGLDPLPATHDEIANTIRSKLTIESSRGDLLYVFWGGHGIITKTEATVRRLFFSDTDDNTKWNLNVNSLVEALGTSAHGSGFPRQIFFIDACANAFYQGLAQTTQGEASEVRFAASGDAARGEQVVLFASVTYDTATNDSASGTGHFSSSVLEHLQGESICPDMKQVIERVQSDFLQQQKQPPVYWWSEKGENRRVIDNTQPTQPKVITLTPPQVKNLHGALIEAFPDPSDLDMLVQFYLHIPLNRISINAKTQDKLVLDVIRYVNARGKILDLVKGALETNPNSPFLLQLKKAYL
ncbi:caspase family protein [Cyanobacteria bacterium FACHB-63]|nr:caspase family protein [Cyanobacteria bacterium FACHB-63]